MIIGEVGDSGPARGVRCAQELKDLAKLIAIVLPWKKRAPRRHLCEDAPHAPDVHRGAVLPAPQ